MSSVRAEMNRTLIGALLMIFCVLMISDLFSEDETLPEVQVCVEPAVDPAVIESLSHNEDSYPVRL